MSIPYLNIKKAVLLRSGQVADAGTAAAFEAIFTDAALANVVGGMELPLTGLQYAVLASEKRLASLCAKSENPVLRTPLYGKSAEIESGARIPAANVNQKQFIGNFGAVFDGEIDEPLTEKPSQTVLRMNRLYTSGSLKVQPMHFAIKDGRLLHTRDGAYIEGCIWDLATQVAAYADGSSPLAQELETFWIADVLANLVQESWFIQESGVYRGIATMCEQSIKEGVIPQAILPDSTASSSPVVN